MGVDWQDLKYIWFVLLFLSLVSGNEFLVCFVLIPSVPRLLYMAHKWLFTRWQFTIFTLTLEQSMWVTYCLYYTPLLYIAVTTDWQSIEL